MYKAFHIKNFRCFDDLTIEPFERINLITGKNNVGKTALLEALWLHHGYQNPELGFRISAFRGLETLIKDELFLDLFRYYSPEDEIVLSSTYLNHHEENLRITVKEHHVLRISEPDQRNDMNGETTESLGPEIIFEYKDSAGNNVRSRAIAEKDGIRFEPADVKHPLGIYLAARRRESQSQLAERIGNMEVKKAKGQVVDILRVIEPRLKDLIVRVKGGASMIYGELDDMDRLLALPLMGDGMGRLLSLGLAIAEAKDGIALVDEFENGLHYSVQVDIWKAAAASARKYNVQLFATTHSEECIRAAYKAFKGEDEPDFRIHRLEWLNGAIRAVTYDEETFEAALEAGLEVR